MVLKILQLSLAPLLAIEGGNIGWINSNAISSKVLNLINNLKIGEVSDPFLQPKQLRFLNY